MYGYFGRKGIRDEISLKTAKPRVDIEERLPAIQPKDDLGLACLPKMRRE